jgi:uncharacterized protein (TIGR02001 family)
VRDVGWAAAWSCALLATLIVSSGRSVAADSWGGSLGVTSDYLVRGITRSDDQAALQLDLHYAHSSGLIAGLFISNTQIDEHEPRDVELSGFIGWAFDLSPDWRTQITASHYAYPWNQHGSSYDYDELNAEVAYQGWLRVNLEYSPDFPRFVQTPYSGLVGEAEKAIEVSAQRPVWRTLSVLGGVGYSFVNGPDSAGYVYWSAGAAYDIKAVSLVLAYVNTSHAAKALFSNDAANGRWTGTVIWRF